MLILPLLQSIGNSLETFENEFIEPDGIKSLYLYMIGYNAKYYYNWKVTDYIALAIFYIIAFIVSLWSAYLSFTCTWKGSAKNIFIRVVTAFFAFMLGPIYLIYYFFINNLFELC